MSHNNRSFKLGYATTLALAAVLYTASCTPGPQWQDSGGLQYRIWHNDIKGSLGLAASHPLYHILAIAAKYIPIGEFGYRINLTSAIFAAITTANIYAFLRLWQGGTIGAIVAATSLALSHTFWGHACVAETYTLYTALFTGELIMLLLYFKTKQTRYLYWLAFLNGLAISNHMLGIIPLVCYAILVTLLAKKGAIHPNNIVVMALLWVIGAGPYECLIINNWAKSGDLAATLHSAFFGDNWQGAVLNTSISPRLVVENLVLVAFNFPTPNILLLLVGITSIYKISPDSKFAHTILAMSVLMFAFASRYTVPDRYAFFIPFYCLCCILIGVGAHTYLKKHPQKLYTTLMIAAAILPPALYGIAPTAAERLKLDLGTKRVIPYRNNYKYFLQPWQTFNHGPELFAESALNTAEERAVILADTTTVYPLWYLQTIRQKRLDVKILCPGGHYKNPMPFPEKEGFNNLLTKTTVYVVTPHRGYCPTYLLEGYDFTECGPIYRVNQRKQ